MKVQVLENKKKTGKKEVAKKIDPSMKKTLIIVDVQNDFVDGSLGTPEAINIIPNVVKKIKGWDGDIICTRDTHFDNYLNTNEGRHLPVPHCIEGTNGHKINAEVLDAVTGADNCTIVDKFTFGSTSIPGDILKSGYDYIELVGLCTDICVISNALLLKAHYPEIDIAVDASCCAGVTPESHAAAIMTMKMCQIDVIEN